MIWCALALLPGGSPRTFRSLVSEVGSRGTGLERQAVRGRGGLPPVLAAQSKYGERTRNPARRRLRRRHPFLLRRRPGAVAAFALQLSRLWRVLRPLPRHKDPADQYSAVPPGGGASVCEPAGGSPSDWARGNRSLK